MMEEKEQHLPQLQQYSGRVRIPHYDASVIGGCGQQGSVRRELAGHHIIMVAFHFTNQSVLIHVPQEHL